MISKRILASALALLLAGAFSPPALCETQPVYITIDPQAALPDEDIKQRAYPATLMRGENAYQLEPLLEALLGEGYEYTSRERYESRDPNKPDRSVSISKFTGQFQYRDNMVTGERYGEYEPPNMNMMPGESLVFCKSLLQGAVDSTWLEHVGIDRRLSERWSHSERWMTDSEYANYMKNMDAHYFTFEHMSDEGVRILDDEILAAVGVNGLSVMRMSWHEFAAGDELIAPMPLDEAISMANSTRSSAAVLLAAQLVYSNWLTESDEYNLSWYLITSQGSYVADCVLGKHICDSYEY